MAGYIKSHSNYRLQTRHQLTNDGTIFERDISTIGGVDSFATGQATIYQSGNFVMVVNNTKTASRHIKVKEWLASGDNNDTWDVNSLLSHSSDVNGSVEDKIMLKNDFMDLRSFAYYGSLADLVQNTVTKILSTFPYELYETDNIVSGSTADGYYEVSNPGNIDIHNVIYDDGENELGHFYDGGYNNYAIYFRPELESASGTPFTWNVDRYTSIECPERGVIFATITLTYNTTERIVIYAYWDNNLNIRYMTPKDRNRTMKFHIRPKMDKPYYDDFVDGLDLFGKCLVGVYSGIKNTAKFEVLSDTENGTEKTVSTFTFPDDGGGYNLGSDTMSMQRYISSLGGIAIRYDNLYTDNLYRLMTHDSLKNLDWTKNFNGNDGDYDNEYTQVGKKFSSVVRIMGYVFDNEKSYIDSIGNVNSITYSDRDNLSDYFLTDSLEEDGWIINTIYPYSLTEYDSDGDEAEGIDWAESAQTLNPYTRKFNEITSDIIEPYSKFVTCSYLSCDDGDFVEEGIDCGGSQYYVDDNGTVHNVMTSYQSDREYTIPEINNKFMKIFSINSKYLLRKKGTIEGVESLLSLFGMKSKKWCESHEHSFSGASDYDYEIKEYIAFSTPIEDTYDSVHSMYKYDWYNKCKTIPYDTDSYRRGIYIPYQGLPVSYREVKDGNNTVRKLYPYFNSYGIYDGDMYYQMNGGWIGYLPYKFSVDDSLILQNDEENIRVETFRNVMLVNNMTELINQPKSDLYDGIVYYVTDLSEKFALIDGYAYPLLKDTVNGSDSYYFEAVINNSSVTVGDRLFSGSITVSDSREIAGVRDYNLGLYEDGYVVRVYYTGVDTYAFLIMDSEYYEEGSIDNISNQTDADYDSQYGCYIFMNGVYPGSDDNGSISHYFKLVNIDNSDKIGFNCWEKIKESSDEYKIINSIVDNTYGNNPHSGNYKYDNGNEYINRFNHLFKYAYNNDLFNEACFTDPYSAYTEISDYGFNCINHEDEKVHAFIDSYDKEGSYHEYDINTVESLSGVTGYEYFKDYNGADSVTDQIMNTKRFDITFYVNNVTLYEKNAQEYIKYIQAKIMPYVEQMIPSTLIVNVDFVATGVEYGVLSCYGSGAWLNDEPWINDDSWLNK